MMMKRRRLSLAVASVSLSLVTDSLAVPVSGDNPQDCAASLTSAIANVNSYNGQTVVIDPTVCGVIELSSTIEVIDKAVIIQAEVTASGQPQVVISAATGGFGLFEFGNSSLDPNDPFPIVFSGIELSGASKVGPGGAIAASNHVLVIDKSVIKDNEAEGAGGGISMSGQLCLQGSELSDNTVKQVRVATADSNRISVGTSAIGGGAAVSGTAIVQPSFSSGYIPISGPFSPGNENCLTGPQVKNIVSTAFEEAAAALAGNPAGLDVIVSKVTGNSAVVTADIEYYDGEASGFAALGGGIASFAREQPGSTQSKYGGVTLFQAIVAGNEASVVVTNSATTDARPKYSVSAGGGVFAGADFNTDSQGFLAVKYSEVRDNTVVLDGLGAVRNLAMGGGLATSNSDLLQAMAAGSGWLAGEADAPDSGDGVAGVTLFASVVSGNTVQLTTSVSVLNLPEDDEADYFTNTAIGGGIAAANELNVDGAGKYSSLVASVLSTVSDNTVDVESDGVFVAHAAGGGIATGALIFDYDAPSYIGGKLGRGYYLGFSSGVSGNEVTVSGVSGDEQPALDDDATIGGGGVRADAVYITGVKPEYEVIAGTEDSASDGYLPFPIAVFTDSGGVANNAIEIAGSSGNIKLIGGGVWSGDYYSSFQKLEGASITGNSISAANESNGVMKINALGGGVGRLWSNDDSEEVGEGFPPPMEVVASTVSDNTISISGSSDALAAGGGIGVSHSLGKKLLFSLEASTVSGNKIEVSAVESAVAGGGGVFAQSLGRFDDNNYTLTASTIANNELSVSDGSGDVSGAGLLLIAEDLTYLDSLSIVGNTSTMNGEAKGGQAALDGEFALINTLITGNDAQGAKDLYLNVNEEIDGTGSAVFHGEVPSNSGFLPAALANPEELGPLQFNGFAPPSDTDKYYGPNPVKTIALLEGSGAIDPLDGDNECLTEASSDSDQRGYPRDSCRDIGAYERLAERDGDGLVDDAELGAPATDPAVFSERSEGALPAYPNVPGDGNSDGLPDVDQASVASFSVDNGHYTLGLVDQEGFPVSNWGLTGVSAIPALAEPIQVEGGTYVTLTGVSFTVDTGNNSEDTTAYLELIVPASYSESSLIKQQCNGLQEGEEPELLVLDDSPDAFGEGRVRFLFELKENGKEDCNGTDNNISDPAFIAQFASSRITPVPVMSWLGLGLMSGLVGLLGVFGMRKRRGRGPSR